MKGTGYPFNDDFQFPFPQLPIVVQNGLDGTRTNSLDALIDTGADGTFIPISYLHEIEAHFLDDVSIRSHWGEWRKVPQFVVNIIVSDLTLLGIFVIGDEEGEDVILGRDVLNKLRFELDGPARITRLPNQ
jgi:predicted aspartyl protease